MLFRSPDVLRDAGITSVPDRPEDAWSWDELADVADRLTDATPDGSSAFGGNWQALGAFRWRLLVRFLPRMSPGCSCAGRHSPPEEDSWQR